MKQKSKSNLGRSIPIFPKLATGTYFDGVKVDHNDVLDPNLNRVIKTKYQRISISLASLFFSGGIFLILCLIVGRSLGDGLAKKSTERN